MEKELEGIILSLVVVAITVFLAFMSSVEGVEEKDKLGYRLVGVLVIAWIAYKVVWG